MTELIEMVTSFGGRIEQSMPSEADGGVWDRAHGGMRRAERSWPHTRCSKRSEGLRRKKRPFRGPCRLLPDCPCRGRHGDGWATPGVGPRTPSSALLQRAGPGEVVVDASAAGFVDRHFATEPGRRAGGPRSHRGTGTAEIRARGRTLSPFVGRAPDVEALHALMRRVEAGEAHVVGSSRRAWRRQVAPRL